MYNSDSSGKSLLSSQDLVLTSFAVVVHAGGVVGCFYLGTLLSNFGALYTIDGDEIDRTIGMLTVALWIGFVSDMQYLNSF